jgi:uncharacterized protein
VRTKRWTLAGAGGLFVMVGVGAVGLGEMAVSGQGRAVAAGDGVAVELRARDGVVLRGEWSAGTGGWKAAVLLLHGVSDSRRGMESQGRMLREAGYGVLAVDARGHGMSGGGRISYGVLERRDVAAWVEWIRARDGVGRVFGVGSSMGGAILLQSLPEARLDAVVAECAFSDFRAVAYHRVGQRLGLEERHARWVVWPAVEPALEWVRWRYGLNLRQASPVEGLRTSSTPVLLIHGVEDRNIPPEHSERLLRARERDIEIWRVAAAGHVNAISTAPEEYRRRVLEFFARRGE